MAEHGWQEVGLVDGGDARAALERRPRPAARGRAQVGARLARARGGAEEEKRLLGLLVGARGRGLVVGDVAAAGGPARVGVLAEGARPRARGRDERALAF